MILLVGLGNTTPDSNDNRHNVGFKIIDTINKKTYLITNEKIESPYLDEKKYFLSKEKEKTYRIKKRSMTINSNIIFTLVFKPKDTSDNGLSKLKEEIKKTK